LFDLLFDSFVLSVFKFLDRSRDCKNVYVEIEFLNYEIFVTSQQKIRSTTRKDIDQTKVKKTGTAIVGISILAVLT